jgi:hypothetical protein
MSIQLGIIVLLLGLIVHQLSKRHKNDDKNDDQ